MLSNLPTKVVAFVFLVFSAQSVLAATEEASKANEKAANESATEKKTVKKTTEVSFEDVLVQGKYHFSDEAVTTVEDDKVLDALLGVRKDFQDRLKKSAERF